MKSYIYTVLPYSLMVGIIARLYMDEVISLS